MKNLLVIFFALYSANLIAASGKILNNLNESCAKFSSDPYEPTRVMPRGPFAGNCLNVEERRNLILLNEDKDIYEIANFYHNEKFYRALVPKGEIFERAILQVEYFPPEVIAAHTQMRFDLKEGKKITLIGQNNTNQNEVIDLNSLIISFEAVRSYANPKYDLLKGLMDHFGMGARIFSLQTSYQKIVKDQGHKNDQVVLDFTSEELPRLFKYYIDRGHENKDHGEMYNTLTSNCTTEIYEGMEYIRPMPTVKVKCGPHKARTCERKRIHLGEVLPARAVKHTKVREIYLTLEKPLEEEFSSKEEIFEN